MAKTGIVRYIDDLGRIVIPKEIRRTLRIREGDPLEISVENDRIIFEKYDITESSRRAIEKTIALINEDGGLNFQTRKRLCQKMGEVLKIFDEREE